MLVRNDEETIWIADSVPFLQEISICVKNLNALVLAIADINFSFVVDSGAVRKIKFTRAGPIFAPGLGKCPARSNFTGIVDGARSLCHELLIFGSA